MACNIEIKEKSSITAVIKITKIAFQFYKWDNRLRFFIFFMLSLQQFRESCNMNSLIMKSKMNGTLCDNT